MIICGIKFTHDGSIALIENNELVFCVEIEKLKNNKRYSEILNNQIIDEILHSHGYSISDIDLFAVDGWGGDNPDQLAIQPRLEIGEGNNFLLTWDNQQENIIKIAPYSEKNLQSNILEEWSFDGLKINDQELSYVSYLHAAGHIAGTYCTSPFAQNHEDAFVLVWDGGMYPRLYYIDVNAGQIKNLGPIFLLIGNIYTIFSQYFGPFKVNGKFAKDNLSVAGKVMAYIALGTEREELYKIFDKIYAENYDNPMGFANVFANKFITETQHLHYKDEDILATFHKYIERLLISKLKKKISRFNFTSKNLCISGGCGLNIKWNSAIRETGFFSDVYVAPFPNDSGSAIGAACCAMINHAGTFNLKWSVYCGAMIINNQPSEGWRREKCSIEELADLLFRTNESVVFLNQKAELGPRALGNRSIIASPSSPKMKDILNEVKNRESYRPVSPICLVEDAPSIFVPGCEDPFMLFDHTVKEEWIDKIPAVMHLDGSARLQTVSENDNPIVYKLLAEFKRLSGIPLLCNTSANYKGSGFFPDLKSATEWNRVNYVWLDNYLYIKNESIKFF